MHDISTSPDITPPGPPPPLPPPSPAPEWEIAGPGRRLAARLLDGFFLVVWFFVALFVGAVCIGLVRAAASNSSDDIGLDAWVLVIVVLAIAAAYEPVFIAMKGQTFGKQILRIKVINAETGYVPGWGKSMLRAGFPTAVHLIPVIGQIAVLVIYMSILGGERNRGWHDQLAGTMVMKLNKGQRYRDRPPKQVSQHRQQPVIDEHPPEPPVVDISPVQQTKSENKLTQLAESMTEMTGHRDKNSWAYKALTKINKASLLTLAMLAVGTLLVILMLLTFAIN